MQLQRAFPGVEDPAEMMAEMPCRFLDRDLRHQVQVKLGAQPGQPPGQDLRPLVRCLAVQVAGNAAVGEVRQAGQVVARRGREAAPDHACLQVRVQARGDDGVLGAAHHDQLVPEVVTGPAPVPDLLAQGVLLRLGQGLDDQYLEVRPGSGGLLCRRIPGFGLLVVAVRQRPPAAGPVGPGDKRPVDVGHHPGKPGIAASSEQVPGAPVSLRARERPVLLDRGKVVEQPGCRLGHAIGRLVPQRRVR
jgi:hypothetical protein